MKRTKREKEKELKALKCTTEKERRLQKKLSASSRTATLRAAQQANELHEITTTPRDNGRDRVPPRWQPPTGSVVELEASSSDRMIIGVLASVVPALLRWLAPRLLHVTGARLTARGGLTASTRRGASIILTTSSSSSGPHSDAEDTLLLNVSGERRVWYARPQHASERLPRSGGDGAPVFLPAMCDPSLPLVQKGVEWCRPVTLRAGDAIWIPRGWWHCVASEMGGVAMPLEVVHGSVCGSAPCVFRHVAARKQESGRSTREVSRRSSWGSAKSVRELWSSEIARFGTG